TARFCATCRWRTVSSNSTSIARFPRNSTKPLPKSSIGYTSWRNPRRRIEELTRMQISYKLPGLLPEPAPAPIEEKLPGPSFRNRIRRMPRPVSQSWRGLLGLQHAPAGAGPIGAPPRPARLTMRDAGTERLRWREMLDRHCRFFDRMASQVVQLKLPPTE